MAHYDIFREQLGIKYPAYGVALWEPSPGKLYSPVEIGDVGYVRGGKFHRIFNALLPADDPSQKFGVPEYYEPLTLTSEHIDIGTVKPNHYYSHGISVAAAEPESLASSPDSPSQVTYLCRRRQRGAILSLPLPAQRQDTITPRAFGEWMIKHIDRWFVFTQQRKLGIEMEHIILVTGCHRTRSWAVAAFLEGQDDAQVSFGVKMANVDGPDISISWRFSHERNRGAVVDWGPDGKNLPEDQCVFIRGFRVTRPFKFLPKHLVAAAGPSSDPDEDNSDPDVELTSMPNVIKYRDPLQLLFEHLIERVPECDMVLVHDDDLAQIGGIRDSTESLDSHVLGHLLQKSRLKIQRVKYYRQSTDENTSKIIMKPTTIAMCQKWVEPPNDSEQSPTTPQSLQSHPSLGSTGPTSLNDLVEDPGMRHQRAQPQSITQWIESCTRDPPSFSHGEELSLTDHLSSNECLRCGQKDHRSQDCRMYGDGDSDSESEFDDKITHNTKDSTKVNPQPDEFWDFEQSSSHPSILCPIDNRVLDDAVKMPCCGTAYCENCIRTHLLENDFSCPHCLSKVTTSLDNLAIDKSTRRKLAHHIAKEIETIQEEGGQNESTLPTSVSQTHTIKDAQTNPHAQDNVLVEPAKSDGIADLQAQIQQITLTPQTWNRGTLPAQVHRQVVLQPQHSALSSSHQNPRYTPIQFVRSDGFLVRMFGHRDAVFFIESLLKMRASDVYVVGNVPGWPGALMVDRPSVADTRYDAVMMGSNNRPLWFLDFTPLSIYHVVPQRIWTPPNQSDWRRYVEQANLRMPIFFIQMNGAIGLPLPRATVGDSASLRSSDSPAPLGGGHSTQIRIAWPGYEPWERQIQIRDQTPHRNEITLERFAKLVAGVVDRFLTSAATTTVGRDPNWRVGPGGINRNRVIIVGTVQVSAGGWMPILQVFDPSSPPAPTSHGYRISA